MTLLYKSKKLIHEGRTDFAFSINKLIGKDTVVVLFEGFGNFFSLKTVKIYSP